MSDGNLVGYQAYNFNGRPGTVTFNLSEFSYLQDGRATLRIEQDAIAGANYQSFGRATLNITADAVSAVPELVSWAMMLVGFGALGAIAR